MKFKVYKLSILIIFVFQSFCLSTSAKESDELTNFVNQYYKVWNEHNIDSLMEFYSSSYVSGDGITKSNYQKLTEKLWIDYPDIVLQPKDTELRLQDGFAVLVTNDYFKGQSKDQVDTNIGDMKSLGLLTAISKGFMYLKKYGKEWKIESDHISYELLTVTFGNALNYLEDGTVFFSVPEQINAGDQYSASLYTIFENDFSASAVIEREKIMYHDKEEEISDEYQPITSNNLERLFQANTSGFNELCSATLTVYKNTKLQQLDGVLYISKRVNIKSAPEIGADELMVTKPFALTE